MFVKNLFWLFAIALLASCKTEVKTPDPILSRGGENYEDLIRIPVSAETPADTVNVPKLKFQNPSFNFGKIKEGEKVIQKFHFENTGKKDLYILDSRVSCGCTVAKLPEEKIPPGEGGMIIVEFDSEGKIENQEKKIVVLSNTYPNESILTLEGFVIPKSE